MVRFVALLLLLLEALAALVPAQGLFVCLGAPGTVGGAAEVVATCDCGHHGAPSTPVPASDPAPVDQDCDGCVDLDVDSIEAVPPGGGGHERRGAVPVQLACRFEMSVCGGPYPDRPRARGFQRSDPRGDAPPISARVLRERATVQLLR